jgi:hypothetical protein
MSSVFTGAIYHALKATLDQIADDKSDGYEADADYTKWCEERGMPDNYVDDQEYGGPGLAAEVEEGAEIPTGTIREGATTRYTARKFALRLIVSEEAMEDSKYDQVISAAKRLKRSIIKTADIDATNMLVRATNTSYVGGDGKPLASASHTLPHGGTFSNTMATPFSPSRLALIQATSSIRKYPGHDGVTEGYQPKRVLCPTEQWALWDGILQSDKVPESNANEINVVKKLRVDVLSLKFWDNTTTNWAIQTDCDLGLTFRWRRKPKSRSWVENSQELMSYAISARWARGWTDSRCIHFVDA